MEVNAQCPVCAGTASRVWYRPRPYTIRQCLTCTHGFVDPMPSEAELDELYRDQTDDSLLGNGMSRQLVSYLDGNTGRYESFYGYRLDALKRAGIEKSARVLDYGCAIGAFVRTLALAGYERGAGYDVAENIVAEGRDRWGLDLHSGDRQTYFAAQRGRFDVVHCANVFEHLRTPAQALDELSALLVPRGHVIISVPNVRSLTVLLVRTRSPVIAPPHHLQYYTPRSLRALLERRGFEVRDLITPFWTSDSDIYLHMLGVPLPIARGTRAAMSWGPSPVIERAGWGGIISVVARRNM